MRKLMVFAIVVIALLGMGSCDPVEYDMMADICGFVLDEDSSEPISGATVSLSPSGKNTTTGTDGYFEFKDLNAQSYSIQVQKSGYSSNRKSVNAIAVEVQNLTITLKKK